MPTGKLALTTMAALTVAAIVAACTGNTVYDRYTAMDGWDRADTATFHVPSATADATYAIELGLRANSNYPYTAISVIVDRSTIPTNPRHANAGTVRSDTLHLQLTDAKGELCGNGLANHQYTLHLPQTHVKQGDSLVITVRHRMKREILPGIENVGIRIKRL